MASESGLNPALTEWTGEHGLPEFGKISDSDFSPAFEMAMQQHLAEIDAIAGNPEQPAFANPINALELAGQSLRRVSALFWHRAGTDSTPEIQALEREIGPLLARHSAQVYMNGALFARIDELHETRSRMNLSPEQVRVLELHHKHFVKEGAKLDEAGKQRLAEINQRLASLAAEFGQNVLSDEAGWTLPLAKEDVTGLPDSLTALVAASVPQVPLSPVSGPATIRL